MRRPHAHEPEQSSRPNLTVVTGGAQNIPAEPKAVVSRGEARADVIDRLAGELIRTFGDQVLFLFHRRPPGQGTDLPIIAVAASGVHLIEPRSYPGKKVRACRDGSEFVIDGMRHRQLAEQMREHSQALQAAVAIGPLPDTPIHASYCFIDSNLPLGRLEVGGFRVNSVRGTLKSLRGRGPLNERQIEALHRDLSLRLERT